MSNCRPDAHGCVLTSRAFHVLARIVLDGHLFWACIILSVIGAVAIATIACLAGIVDSAYVQGALGSAVLGAAFLYAYLRQLTGLFLAAALGRRHAHALIWTRTHRALTAVRDRVALTWRSLIAATRLILPHLSSHPLGPPPITPPRCIRQWTAGDFPQLA